MHSFRGSSRPIPTMFRVHGHSAQQVSLLIVSKFMPPACFCPAVTPAIKKPFKTAFFMHSFRALLAQFQLCFAFMAIPLNKFHCLSCQNSCHWHVFAPQSLPPLKSLFFKDLFFVFRKITLFPIIDFKRFFLILENF